MGKRVFLTGGTGFMGRALTEALVARGDEVAVLTRQAARARRVLGSGVRMVEGDPVLSGPWQAELAGMDAVIHLAGQSVADKRWSAHTKQIIHDSRVESTRYLVEGMAALDESQRPAVLVSASGIDYYPFAADLGAVLPVDEDDEVTEQVPPGDSFLARVCRNWEAEATAARALGVRVVCMRTGVVLGRGGPLARMTLPFRLFVGGRIGSGRQWFSWIHLGDAVRAYLFAMDEPAVSGAVNLVAPRTARAQELARALGAALKRPAWLPVPGFALRLAVGELAEHMLQGRRAVPAALTQHGFEFEHPELSAALAQLLAD